MKHFFNLSALFILVLFISCQQETKDNARFHSITLINNRIQLDIPNTWKNQNPNNIHFYQDTLNEAFYGKELHGDHLSITHSDKEEEDLDTLLKKELIELRQTKQPWSKIIETEINRKNKIITIKTTLHLKNQNDYTEICLVICKHERFYVFFAGNDTPQFRSDVGKMIGSIKIL